MKMVFKIAPERMDAFMKFIADEDRLQDLRWECGEPFIHLWSESVQLIFIGKMALALMKFSITIEAGTSFPDAVVVID